MASTVRSACVLPGTASAGASPIRPRFGRNVSPTRHSPVRWDRRPTTTGDNVTHLKYMHQTASKWAHIGHESDKRADGTRRLESENQARFT